METNNIELIKQYQFMPILDQGFHNSNDKISKYSTKGVWEFTGGQDSYHEYKKNLKKQPEDWYYRNNKVNYTINSFGYRTKEFNQIDWKNSIVMFGCSYVFGTGVDDNHTVPNFLEQMIKIPVINMGIPGSSISLSLHNSLMLYKKYGPPKMVIYSWTSLMRSLVYFTNGVNRMSINNDDIGHKYENHYILQNLLNIELIRTLWENKCPIYEYTMFNQTEKIVSCDLYSGKGSDYARDLEHTGIDTNKTLATLIYNKIKSEIY